MGRRSKLNFTSLFFKPSINLNINGGGGGGGDTTSTPSSSSSSSTSSSTSSWAWPSCKQAPRTDSFRSGPVPGPVPTNMFKTVNSVYLDSTDASLFSTHTQSSDDSLSEPDESSEETVIRGLMVRSADRLLFEPGGHTSSSILPAKKEDASLECNEDDEFIVSSSDDIDIDIELVPFKESVAMAVESSDPYGDFRRSMEEMVAAHGIMMRRGASYSWECLEELLVWYLKVNGKKNHGFIVAAFVDLLVNLNLAAASHSDSDSDSHSHDHSNEIRDVDAVAASSSNSTMSSSVSFEIEEVGEEEGSGSC